MLKILTIIYFLILMLGLGYSLTRFWKEISIESCIARLAIGLGCIPTLGVLLNVLHIPLDWKIFLGLAVAIPAFDLIKNKAGLLRRPFDLKTSNSTLVLLLLFAVVVFVYCRGPFSYPWLEDDDSWSQAAAAKYISTEKNLNPQENIFQYLNPYPPGYPIVMGLLNQVHPSIYWILKFFNGLIIALGYLFFYLFAREMTGEKKRALWALFFLTMIPCYLSHFIWAHALIISLFYPGFYCLLKCSQDRRFVVPGFIAVSSIFLTQPTQCIKFFIMACLLSLFLLIFDRKHILRYAAILLLGIMLSLLWWAPKIIAYKNSKLDITLRYGNKVSAVKIDARKLKSNIFDPKGGSATKAYSLAHFFATPERNLVNNPFGIGPVIFLLAVFGFAYLIPQIIYGSKDEKTASLTVISWFIFTFLGVNTMTFNLPVGLYAFRFWMLLAIPVSFLAGESCYQIMSRVNFKTVKILGLTIIVVTTMITSGRAKLRVNTSIWPFGIYWHSVDEVKGYFWLRQNLPANSKVFAFINNIFVIGNDMRAEYWREEYRSTYANALTFPPLKLSKKLKEQNYEYLIIGERERAEFGEDAVRAKIDSLMNSPHFKTLYHTPSSCSIFQVL